MAAASTPQAAPREVLFVSRVTSRRPRLYVGVAFFWALLLLPLSLNAAVALILPYSLSMGALAGWGTYCIVTNRTWQATVTHDRVTWDRTLSRRSAHVVLTQDILRLSVVHTNGDGGPAARITLHLHDGSERALPTMFTESPEDVAAFVGAIERAVPKVFTRHLS